MPGQALLPRRPRPSAGGVGVAQAIEVPHREVAAELANGADERDLLLGHIEHVLAVVEGDVEMLAVAADREDRQPFGMHLGGCVGAERFHDLALSSLAQRPAISRASIRRSCAWACAGDSTRQLMIRCAASIGLTA